MIHFDTSNGPAYVREHGRAYRRTISVDAVQLTKPTIWTTAAGDTLTGGIGDWKIISDTSEWTVQADIFEATYTRQPDGRWRKTAATMLAQVDEPFTVDTLEGRASGDRGDYLALGAADEIWPIPADTVASGFEPVD